MRITADAQPLTRRFITQHIENQKSLVIVSRQSSITLGFPVQRLTGRTRTLVRCLEPDASMEILRRPSHTRLPLNTQRAVTTPILSMALRGCQQRANGSARPNHSAPVLNQEYNSANN